MALGWGLRPLLLHVLAHMQEECCCLYQPPVVTQGGRTQQTWRNMDLPCRQGYRVCANVRALLFAVSSAVELLHGATQPNSLSVGV